LPELLLLPLLAVSICCGTACTQRQNMMSFTSKALAAAECAVVAQVVHNAASKPAHALALCATIMFNLIHVH
jgi:hypothetical protein